MKIAKYFDVSAEYLIGETDCRQSIRSFEDVFLKLDDKYIKNGEIYDMLSKLSPADRAAIHHMLSVMLKK